MINRVARLLCVLAVGAVVSLAQNAQGQVVYDNGNGPGETLNGLFTVNNSSAGNEINLAPTGNTYISEFQYQFYLINNGGTETGPDGSEAVELSFYENNGVNVPTGPGGYPSPGTLLYNSGFFNLYDAGLTSFNPSVNMIYNPDVSVPQDFTWVVSFENIPTNESAGLALISSPTVGSAYGDVWETNSVGGWNLIVADNALPYNLDLGAEAETTTTVPDSSCVWFSVSAVGAGFWWMNRGIRRQPSA